jgi:hypothetical protein
MAEYMATPAEGPSLGMPPAGHVHVDVVGLDDGLLDAELLEVALDVAHRRLGGLFHDVAELAGEHEAALAGHLGRLDEHDLAADGGPREAGGDAGLGGALGDLGQVLLRAEVVGHVVLVDRDLVGDLALDDLDGDAADDRADLALEVTDAGLVGVAVDQLEQGVVGEGDLDGLLLALVEAVLADLLGQQEAAGDRQRLLAGVAREAQDLEAVLEGRRDRVEVVGGGDEHHLGEVERDLEVVVAEGPVLLGVEDLEQGRAGVAAEVVAELVDLVEHDDRVVGAGPLEPWMMRPGSEPT